MSLVASALGRVAASFLRWRQTLRHRAHARREQAAARISARFPGRALVHHLLTGNTPAALTVYLQHPDRAEARAALNELVRVGALTQADLREIESCVSPFGPSPSPSPCSDPARPVSRQDTY